MKGYLLKEQAFMIGEECFVDSISSENSFAVVFEDDGETGYFYAMELDEKTGEQHILDAVHIYEVNEIAPEHRSGILKIIWYTDWLKCALLLNNYCYAIFDFENHGGYNRNAFPPPNEIWTRGERMLTDEMVNRFFE